MVASRRKKGDRVSVWLRDARRLGAVVDVGRMVRQLESKQQYFGMSNCVLSLHGLVTTFELASLHAKVTSVKSQQEQ